MAADGVADSVVGIDVGTSACKVLAVDRNGTVVAKASHEYPVVTEAPGWAEQDPELWWDAADRGVRQVLDQLPSGTAVRGVGLCGQMHGLTPLDEHDQVLRRAILWNDQRAAPHCEWLTEHVGGLPALLELVQNRMLPGFTAGKVLWVREHEPRVYERMRYLLNPKDYLRLRLTGERATDVSDASGTGLFDVRERAWSRRLLDLVDIPESLLPTVVESQEQTGTLRADVAESWGLPASTPVFGGGGDAVIQTTAMGVIDSGGIGVTLGTAGIVAGASASCPRNPDGRLQVSCGNAPGRWHVMGVSLSAGGAFQWLRDMLRGLDGDRPLEYQRLVELARATPPGAGNLLFLPYLLGERCPHVAPEASASWVGLTPMHGVGHLVRSVMEGVVLNLREILAISLDAGLRCDQVRASGGATAEELWLRLLADVLQQDVVTVTGAAEGGAYGAALVAGVGCGYWDSLDDAATVVHETGTVRPDPGVADVYDRQFAVHRSLYETLGATFTELAG